MAATWHCTLVMLNKLMPGPLLIVSQSDSLIQIFYINSHTEWQTLQIQISWFLQKPTDLDLHCLQRQGISGFSRTRVYTSSKVKSNKTISVQYYLICMGRIHKKQFFLATVQTVNVINRVCVNYRLCTTTTVPHHLQNNVLISEDLLTLL